MLQELKGNIRVFCRVRPVLPGENEEGKTISYPTSLEALGRSIDLIQNGMETIITCAKKTGSCCGNDTVLFFLTF